jgi:membrane protein DedA with SNARE-associated domain
MDPSELIGHWGYVAIFVLVVFGNMGVPLPEETVLLVAGYLVWRGELRLPIVLVVGFISAVVGDNVGYWLGRRFGREALARHASWLLGGPTRLAAMQGFVSRHGSVAVFVARFVPGLRFVAGPLAGALGLPVPAFLAANLLGAAVYVPVTVGLGYGVGYGLGGYLERLRRTVGSVEHGVLLLALLGAAVVLGWRLFRTARAETPGDRSSDPPRDS